MAGIFVSLCVHSVDAVKSVLQSCRIDQKPLDNIGKSIISERGVTGAFSWHFEQYCFFSANFCCLHFHIRISEKYFDSLLPQGISVFGPLLGRGLCKYCYIIHYQSKRANKAADASWFTLPCSNCWNALVEIIQKGGLSSFTGEDDNLKSAKGPSKHHLAVLGHLNCSSPIDWYLYLPKPENVAKTEGDLISGIKAGLTPRLAMYTTQGELFFASYESFKRLLSLEVPQLSPNPIEHEALNSPVSVATVQERNGHLRILLLVLDTLYKAQVIQGSREGPTPISPSPNPHHPPKKQEQEDND
ncbi:Mitochondrial substrate carrier family protein [Forsythia ovata]|uniref:Mitochondrial substrate carrier family protein n=1 Tax=Forsythia ovata TaxID=205694 RepID=A0ABD1SRC6_9LAMI